MGVFSWGTRCGILSLLLLVGKVGGGSSLQGVWPRTKGQRVLAFPPQIRSGHVPIYLKNKEASLSQSLYLFPRHPQEVAVSLVCLERRELGVSNVPACARLLPCGLSQPAPVLEKTEAHSCAGASGNTSHSADLDLTSCIHQFSQIHLDVSKNV